MTLPLAITTMAGGFIFPFLIRLVWGKMVDEWGMAGGYMAAGFIVGLSWTLNHGVGLMYQTGPAWVDMAFAAFSGLFVASALSGDNVGKGLVNAFFAIVGGTIGGLILSMMI
ncbi:hypothetical protein SAMN05660297_01924 [Natronincola peptidivorans]|uniref:Uncharacterized protein n=1 Tax=Natronincola peptidivorans TaxID=426128 RepID=A0A1I0D8Z4_9FIRM|nr:hypothetical protein [Natronincola peptidivorans]SET28733.1 hypothetical protein SAMN05660297_01924 [Natronincola peptidivorans]